MGGRGRRADRQLRSAGAGRPERLRRHLGRGNPPAALRWGVELALDEDDDRATVGFAALLALAESDMLQPDDVPFLTAVTDAALGDAVRRYPGSQARADSEPQEVDADA